MRKYQFEISDQTTKHFIYFDTNLYQRLTKDPKIWNAFFEYFDKHCQSLFEDIELYFTWYQCLEYLGLGPMIMTTIQKNPSWEEAYDQWSKVKDIDTLQRCFTIAYDVVKNIPELSKEKLNSRIEDKYPYKYPDEYKHSNILFQQTALKCKKYIENNNDYIESIAYELTWSFIVSQKFIQGNLEYFSILTTFWHDSFLNNPKFPLSLYRLIDNYNNRSQIKENGDWCDAEGIDLIALGGYYDFNSPQKLHVIFITEDPKHVIEQRISNLKDALEKLKKENEFWSISEVPGEAITIALAPDKKDILSANRIPYNTPFEQPTILNN